MKSQLAVCALALAVGAVPVAANAQARGDAATSPAAGPAAGQGSKAGQLSETQWLHQRVEQLEAALARGDNCAVKLGAGDKTGAGAAGMKSSKKAGKAASPMAPMGMEPMMGGMMGGMKPSPSAKPADKMDPDAKQAPSDPPAMPRVVWKKSNAHGDSTVSPAKNLGGHVVIRPSDV